MGALHHVRTILRGIRDGVRDRRMDRRAAARLKGLSHAGSFPHARPITRGPGHHWFGYYDKLQFDPACRRVLAMRTDFEHRSPTIDDTIRVGFVDLAEGDSWVELGTSNAWGWQQGCMLQWLPNSSGTVVWNDRQNGRFVARVLDVAAGTSRTLPMPIYTITPDGRTAFTIDFGRLQRMRPGYGYATEPPAESDAPAPADIGIWSIDVETGTTELIMSLADVVRFEPRPEFAGAHHWFNHLLVNVDSTRLEFLHRWRRPGEHFSTRMLTMNLDGTEPFVLDPGGHTSHFIWRDAEHILAWSKPEGRDFGFWLFRDRSREVVQVGSGVMTEDGHCTYLPGGEWILNDAYPDRDRIQSPYLLHLATARRVPLGAFYTPRAYQGEWRCDLHPKASPDGRFVCIDSPVGDSRRGGQGRQVHLIDIAHVAS